ncbi:iron-containing alcohol dehydrogenase [Brevibacillus sp. B_LB10_24]|uniref:iron-containing alcohol dehydrogenase n=1 Tax=Brevibacillus sp. B_LB10_24 TaxID=3380645 RepID=UPI0038BB0C5D
MRPFEFNPGNTAISYGIGRSKSVGGDVLRLSGQNKAVLVTDPGLVQIGLAGEVSTALEAEGIEVYLFDDVQSDPSSQSIDKAAEAIRSFGAKCVVGLGGGSAMDVAKCAGLVAGDSHPAEHYALMANTFAPKVISSIMIPTTSGTGAEVTSTVVFSNREQRKVWGWSSDLAPDLAILDPTLTVALPPHLTAATGLDALVHAIEACAGQRSNPLILSYGLQAIRLISCSLQQAIRQPNDLEARGNLSVGAALAGLSIELGGTGIAHCIGHALGTLARVHHGRAVSIALNAVYHWNVAGNISVHADIARALGVNGTGMSEDELALAGAAKFGELITSSKLKTSLEDEGITTAEIERFVDIMLSAENEPMLNNNCRLATHEDLNRFALQILA